MGSGPSIGVSGAGQAKEEPAEHGEVFLHEGDVVDVGEGGTHGVDGRRIVVGVEKEVEDGAGTETNTVVGRNEDFGGVDHADGVTNVVNFFYGGGDLDDVRPEGALWDERSGVRGGLREVEIVESGCIWIVGVGDDEGCCG